MSIDLFGASIFTRVQCSCQYHPGVNMTETPTPNSVANTVYFWRSTKLWPLVVVGCPIALAIFFAHSPTPPTVAPESALEVWAMRFLGFGLVALSG
jgi:hypothetical protein